MSSLNSGLRTNSHEISLGLFDRLMLVAGGKPKISPWRLRSSRLNSWLVNNCIANFQKAKMNQHWSSIDHDVYIHDDMILWSYEPIINHQAKRLPTVSLISIAQPGLKTNNALMDVICKWHGLSQQSWSAVAWVARRLLMGDIDDFQRLNLRWEMDGLSKTRTAFLGRYCCKSCMVMWQKVLKWDHTWAKKISLSYCTWWRWQRSIQSRHSRHG